MALLVWFQELGQWLKREERRAWWAGHGRDLLNAAGLTAAQLAKVSVVYLGTHRNATSDAAMRDAASARRIERDRQDKIAEYAAAGLDPDVTAHVLRHTCATWLLQACVSVYDVAGVLGCSEEVIRRTYGHHAQDHLRQAVAAGQLLLHYQH